MKRGLIFFLSVALFIGAKLFAAETDKAEALVLILGDQHSAYERTAQLVAEIDRLKAAHPQLPVAILLNGDTLEYGNIVARRSSGAVDFAMFAAFAQRAPTILNLGNHEPEFYDLAETIQRIQETGVKVISNITNHATGELFAPASIKLKLGAVKATLVGVTTDHLSTYRLAVRPSLDLANPVVWAKQNFPKLFEKATLSIVLSHAGLNADREMLPLVPAGTLFAGAHDHQRFIHRMDRGAYVHSGSWNEYVTAAWLRRNELGETTWELEQIKIAADGPVDAKLAQLIRETRDKYLTTEDTAIVGQSPGAMSPPDAAKYIVRLMGESSQVDAAFIGNTTFGAGLPAGAVSRVEFDACIRFDGTIFTAEVDGARLQSLMAAANQGPETAFENRRGEYLVGVTNLKQIEPTKRYRIATSDWGARNTAAYFGDPAIVWTELPGPKIKARVLAGLITK